MYLSEYNMYIDLEEYPELSIIQNIFHGRSTIVQRSLADRLRSAATAEDISSLSPEMISTLTQKGFLYPDRGQEDEQINLIYSEFQKTFPTANPSRQYQLLLTYDCNLRCIYCFQKKIRQKSDCALINSSQLENIFKIIETKEESNEKDIKERELINKSTPRLSIVGGEPLLDTPEQRELISSIINFVREKNFHYSITTNGVFLNKYIPIFKESGYFPRNIQITIDGTEEYHDKRRMKAGGAGSFRAIVDNIDYALSEGSHINIRINIDEMNINSINEIADFIKEKGWLNKNEFSAYLAPVTDHSAINKNYKWIRDDSSIISRIVTMFKERPELEKIFTMKNFRGFEYVKRIVKKEGITAPTIWRCEAVLGQLVFDPMGDIYSCFEGAGNDKAKIGTYTPELNIDNEKSDQWRNLNAVHNRFCNSCTSRFVCSSGCPWYIVGQDATECLPVKEEIDLAWNYFAPRVLNSIEQSKINAVTES